MTGIINTELKGFVASTLAALSTGARNSAAWIISMFEESKALFVLNFGKNSSGLVYIFTPVTKPGTWVITTRRSIRSTVRTVI